VNCSIDGCQRESWAAGRCHSHYEHHRRTGRDRGPFPETFEDRFWEKVTSPHVPDRCWIWQAATDGGSRYGSIYRDGRLVRAHRVAYEMLVGPIPDGLVIDHLCRVTLCVNPAHMEVVTQRENIMRGEAPTATNAVKTHCKRGHEFTPENTRLTRQGGRCCLSCEREHHHRSYARRVALRAAVDKVQRGRAA
jgi:hypothetical protein